MHRASRALSFSVVALVAVGACKKKPEVAPAPVEASAPAPTPAPAPPPAQPECDAACMEARNSAARTEAIRAATAALTTTIYFDYDRSDITDDARAKLDQLRAYVELYRALGGGWSQEEIDKLLSSG